MQLLKDTLETVVAETKFDLGKLDEKRSGTIITYSQYPHEIVSPEELRSLDSKGSWVDESLIQVRCAKPITPDDVFSILLAKLHELLGDYIDIKTGNIGHAFPLDSSHYEYTTFESSGVKSEGHVSSVNNFAKALVRGAAILGNESLVDIVSHWVEVKSVTYRTSAILNGLYLSEILKPLSGILIESLPRATDGDFGSVPIHRGSTIEDFLGRTVLSIESVASPAFFYPKEENRSNVVQAKFVPNIGIDKVCQALALESNNSVETAFQWNDYKEASLYLSSRSQSTFSTTRGGMESRGVGFSVRTEFSTGVKSLLINEEKIAHLSETRLRNIVSKMAKQKQEEINVAISRWCKTKESFRTLADQFIDLRITLEALYLKDFKGEQSQEMRFRLALFGAWHLGANVNERKKIRKTLRDTYDIASKAVHGGNLEFSEGNRSLLAEGQRLCRLGILKILKEGGPDDWGELILGSDDRKAKSHNTE